MGVTRFDGLKQVNETYKYGEKELDIGHSVSAGSGACPIATGDGSTASNLGGLIPSSGDQIAFPIRVPANADVTQPMYVDVYTWITGAGTSVDTITLTAGYGNMGTGGGTSVATGDTTTGLTDPTAHNPTLNGMTKSSWTIAADTLTAGNTYNFDMKVEMDSTAKELRIMQKGLFRYVRAYL